MRRTCKWEIYFIPIHIYSFPKCVVTSLLRLYCQVFVIVIYIVINAAIWLGYYCHDIHTYLYMLICCTPVLVLAPGPGPVLHVYVHIRTIRSPWIQVRCQSCRVDCIRQSDLYVTVLLHQPSRDRSTIAY